MEVERGKCGWRMRGCSVLVVRKRQVGGLVCMAVAARAGSLGAGLPMCLVPHVCMLCLGP